MMIKYIDSIQDVETDIYTIKKNSCSNTVYTFDTESTSVFSKDGIQWGVFDYDKPPVYYNDMLKQSVCYLWIFGVNDTVYYGRYIEEFEEVLKQISNPKIKKFIYVHNLSFDFNFLLNFLSKYELKVLSRQKHKLIMFDIVDLNIQFRCSFQLTMLSLDNASKRYAKKYYKKAGAVNYNILRTPNTPLDKTMLNYAEYDCLSLYDVICHYKSEYGSIKNIPLTQTGEVRKYIRDAESHNFGFHKKMQSCVPESTELYLMIRQAFQGGKTQSNRFHTNHIIYETIMSKDITSSYPTVMLSEKFPCEDFHKSTYKFAQEHKEHFCALYTVYFEHVTCNKDICYIPSSKCINLKMGADGIIDNGKLMQAESFTMVLTDIDFEIILQDYDIKAYTVIDTRVAKKSYLDNVLCDCILHFYEAKTTLKGVPEQETYYMKMKQCLNSIYGQQVTIDIMEEIGVKEGQWTVKELTDDMIQSQLDEKRTKWSTITSYAVGCWITAYARRNLWSLAQQINEDVVYMDTDSLKILNYKKHEHLFNEFNEYVKSKITACLETLGLDPNRAHPKDIKGIEHWLGVYDDDGLYKDGFITLGAKKYAYLQDGKVKITVSGVPKSAGKSLKSLEDFKDGYIFNYKDCNKMISYYNDNYIPMTLYDDFGNSYTSINKFGICLMPTTYEIGLERNYARLLLENELNIVQVEEDNYTIKMRGN